MHQQPQKKKGGGSANAPHCARSASDHPTRPFFPLSATKALRTTVLVLVSQGFGCPTVVQGLSKRVQWRGRELSNSAIIKFSSLSAPTKIEELTAGSDEKTHRIRKTLGSIPGGAALCFFVWSGCQFFYLCRCWKRREFDRNDPDKSEFPQLSSTVVRLVLEEKLSAFPLRPVATFTLFDQVSRACPWFSPLREASGRQSEICACSSVPFPAPSTEISCLQVSAKRREPLTVSSPLTSSWASSSYSALPQVSRLVKRQSERFQRWGREDDEQANESDSFPDPVELAMSKHEWRAPRQSQLKLKSKENCIQLSKWREQTWFWRQNSNYHRKWRELACFASWRRSATPTACATSAEMALGLRQTSHSAGHWRFLPPFFFVAVGAIFFQRPLTAPRRAGTSFVFFFFILFTQPAVWAWETWYSVVWASQSTC